MTPEEYQKADTAIFARLLQALHDAINRPKGVVPDSALEFYDPEMCEDNQ